MRDDVNYRQRAEGVKLALMNSLTVSDFAKHRSEYNWINTQKQSLSRGDLPKDRKQFLDKFLPRWDYDTEVLLENMHSLKVKELYNQGYTDLKIFAEENSIKDAYILAYSGILDIKTLMNIPANLLVVKNINNSFLSNLQKKLREGMFKPTKRAFNLSQAISKTQYWVLKHYCNEIKGSDLAIFWLYRNVKYTYSLTARQLVLFNFCSPSYYNEKTGQVEMVYSPNQVSNLVIRNYNFKDDYNRSAENILSNLYKTWNNPAKMSELTSDSQYSYFLHCWEGKKKMLDGRMGGSSNFDGHINPSSSSLSGGSNNHSGHSVMGAIIAANAMGLLDNDDGDDDGDGDGDGAD